MFSAFPALSESQTMPRPLQDCPQGLGAGRVKSLYTIQKRLKGMFVNLGRKKYFVITTIPDFLDCTVWSDK